MKKADCPGVGRVARRGGFDKASTLCRKKNKNWRVRNCFGGMSCCFGGDEPAFSGIFPPGYVFMLAATAALLLNYRSPQEQMERIYAHA